MVAIPAWVWRYPLLVRAVIVGLALGLVVGLLAWIGSDNPVIALIVLVVSGLLYGTLMGRRMAKYWPNAKDMSGADRVAVARAARAGLEVEPRLAGAVVDYSLGVHKAADNFRLWWWLVVLLGVVALGTAIVDTIIGPVREAVVSWLYFAFFPVEIFWWPRRHDQLLARVKRAEQSAGDLLAQLDH